MSATELTPQLLVTIQQGTLAYRRDGRALLKSPFDLAIFPALLERARPRTLIEIGSHEGGSAIWFAGLRADLQVVSIDLRPPSGVVHPRVTFLEGDALDLQAALPAARLEALPRPWLIVEDADHRAETCAAVLEFFAGWLRAGEYHVVEDGIVTAMGLAGSFAGGPLAAITQFLGERDDYEIDRELCDMFGRNVTWNVDGYLRRVR